MSLNVRFFKTGKEIKSAIENRVEQLQSRLDSRNKVLDKFLDNRQKVRSYLVRHSENDFLHHGRQGGASTLYGRDEISSEEKQEISQICRRIFDLEQEILKLKLIHKHIIETDTVELTYNDLIEYGFSIE